MMNTRCLLPNDAFIPMSLWKGSVSQFTLMTDDLPSAQERYFHCF